MSKKMNKWRLPTMEELEKLYEESNSVENKIYWSSNDYNTTINSAWGVFFGNGYTSHYNKMHTFCVRLVKDTKNGLEWAEASPIEMIWNEAVAYAKNMNKNHKLLK